MQTKIQKWSICYTAKLRKNLLESANFRADQIIIQKIKKHKTMKERLQNFEGQYEFKEWNTGKSVGNEVL